MVDILTDEQRWKIVDKLREEREKQNISQAELAKKAGLNANYVAKVERHITKRPSYETLIKIITALKLETSNYIPL